jgi:diacylglycerol kinase (ATP)
VRGTPADRPLNTNGPGELRTGTGEWRADPASPRRCVLVLNPRSRNGDGNRDELVSTIRAAGVALIDDQPVDAEALPEVLRRHRPELRPASDRILVGGGDGTINRLLPHLVEASLPLGILPMGTANDLANTLGLPEEPHAAVQTALFGHVVRVDLGRVNGKLFANVASIGLGPKVTEKLSAELKKQLGALGYPRALLDAYRESRPFHCGISVDGGPERRVRALHLAVGNGRFYGGGATVFEDARIDDERLDLFSLAPMPLWRLLLVAPWVKLGRHRAIDDVYTLHGRTVSVSTRRPLPISADGEILAQTPACFEVLPGALSVVVGGDGPAPGLGAPHRTA